jgi:hypothetical protein
MGKNQISPQNALESIIEFYNQYKTELPDDAPDNDMLLFQYGYYDWSGQGIKFQLNVTRQIADPNDDEFFQFGITLNYRPEDIEEIEDFNLWSMDSPSVEEWKEIVMNTDGFKRASASIPINYEISKAKT